MGLDINGVKLLLHAKQLEVNFDRVLTIGRQMLYLREKELRRMLIQAGLIAADSKDTFAVDTYAETFLKMLGAEVTDSLDASAYEEASMIHDLNLPLPKEMRSKYSVVIDGGSLEHVFNFPIAIQNCMNLIETDGYYIGITPANNFLGHGFYQFSPELYYRIFSPSNGFRMVKMYLYVDRKRASFYEVLDPLELKQRVIMANASPSYLFILAQKTEEKEVFKVVPQQSDYEHIVWNEGTGGSSSGQVKQKNTKVGKLTGKWTDLYHRLGRPMGNSNPQSVRKIDLDLSGNNS
ncbi:MAG: hypothetical protein KAI08_06075 [Bacteroidales bacterium]|nr:hypothetical protein [Bacteroidales bacterium]